MLLLLLLEPFRVMRTWRKTMEPKNLGKSSGSKPEVVENERQREEVFKERAAQRVRSWTAQIEMRSVLGRVSAGTA